MFHDDAAKEYEALPTSDRARFRAAFDRLQEDPFQPRSGVDVRRLEGAGDLPLYRLRIGRRRACYAVLAGQRRLLVLLIAERGEGYGRLLRRALARLRGFAR